MDQVSQVWAWLEMRPLACTAKWPFSNDQKEGVEHDQTDDSERFFGNLMRSPHNLYCSESLTVKTIYSCSQSLVEGPSFQTIQKNGVDD